jgi:hypothetical protein
MFSCNDVSFLEWLEALEADAVRLIYEKRNTWISADLEKSDIEAGFTSPVRPYKGGKHYLIRAHIQPSKTQSSSCSVFDENERPVSVEHIKAEHQMYTVLEFQGIKFTSRSFQLEVALKQVLLVSNVPIFQSCVIRKPNATVGATSVGATSVGATSVGATSVDATSVDATSVDATSVDATSVDATSVDATSVDATSVDATSVGATSVGATNDTTDDTTDDTTSVGATNDTTSVGATSVGATNDATVAAGDNQELQEISLDGLEEVEHMHLKLKKPSEVYYNMYRNAKQKARELKKSAIAAYLEAKQIKSAHMLKDSDSDEDDDDDEDEEDEEDEDEGKFM